MYVSTETTIVFPLTTKEIKGIFIGKVEVLIFKPAFPMWPTNGIIYDKNKKKLVGMVDFETKKYLDLDDIEKDYINISQYQGNFESLKNFFTHGSWNRTTYKSGIVIPITNLKIFVNEIDPRRIWEYWNPGQHSNIRFTYKCCRRDKCKLIEVLAFA